MWGNPAISNPIDILDVWAQAYGNDFSHLPDVESKATAVRGLLADKKTLIVLDNVDDAASVRPLLPSGGGCQVLLTTRNLEVAAAINARHVRLKEFSAESSEKLMVRILGEDRLTGPPIQMADAHRISEQLHHLPLAIEIAAQRLRSRPSMPLAALATRLENTQQRLGLKINDQAVRSSFEVSWEGLPIQTQEVFAGMAIFEGRSFTAEALAAICEIDFFDLEDEIYSLMALSLIKEGDGGRYQQHPLLADFAAEKLAKDQVKLMTHQARSIAYYLTLVKQVDSRYAELTPEWDQLTSIIELAYQMEDWDSLLTLVDLLTPIWKVRGRYSQARKAYQLVDQAVQQLDDKEQKALVLLRWGEAALEQNDYVEAETHLQASLTNYMYLEEGEGIAQVQYLLARISIDQNQFQKANRLLKDSEQVLRTMSLENKLGDILFQQGVIAYSDGFNLEAANELFDQALHYYQLVDDVVGEIEVLRLKAHVAQRRKEFESAETLILQAKRLSEQLNDRGQIASNLFTLMGIYFDQGKLDLAKETAEASLNLFRITGSTRMEGLILRQLSQISQNQEDYEVALDLGLQSLEIFKRLDIKLSQAFTYNYLGRLYKLVGEAEKAQEMWQAAFRLATELDHQALIDFVKNQLT